MTVQSKTAARPSSVTTGPIVGSRKVYTSPEGRPDIGSLPFREIALDPSAREEPYRIVELLRRLHRPGGQHRPGSRPGASACGLAGEARVRAPSLPVR